MNEIDRKIKNLMDKVKVYMDLTVKTIVNIRNGSKMNTSKYKINRIILYNYKVIILVLFFFYFF
ncbi:hypothetical protein LEP1GSC012_2481 [Leptospira interrogans serovar Valbuzzi str. Valbuzzi]|nr:hypothetical protein LEP1GSC012_2481 [Leptospira interrogans serovar Valbuzzi str. Valbuzzi]